MVASPGAAGAVPEGVPDGRGGGVGPPLVCDVGGQSKREPEAGLEAVLQAPGRRVWSG